MQTSNQKAQASPTAKTPRQAHWRRLHLALAMLCFALPVAGALVSFLQIFSGEGLHGVSDLALSPDGQHLYATGREDNTLVVFNRNGQNGLLSPAAVHEDGIDGIFGLLGASGVAASPDQRHVYVSAETDDTLAVFRRDGTSDQLAFVAGQVKEDLVGGVIGLDGASAVTVSPDGLDVFVAARVDGSLAVFRRDGTNDNLAFVEAEFFGAANLDGASSVAVSPDNKHVYLAAEVADTIAVFSRNLTTGSVDFLSQVADGQGGVDGLDGVSGVALSPDGMSVYATGRIDDAVTVFDRDPATGALSPRNSYRDGVGGIEGLAGASSVAVHSLGTLVFVTGHDDNAVAIFDRDPSTGDLSFKEVLRDGVDGVDGLAGAFALALSSENAYAAGQDDGAVTSFGLDIEGVTIFSDGFEAGNLADWSTSVGR